MSHLTGENRKTIASMLVRKASCKEIAEAIGCDPTTTSKEIKKNSIIPKETKGDKKILYKKLDRYPFVCLMLIDKESAKERIALTVSFEQLTIFPIRRLLKSQLDSLICKILLISTIFMLLGINEIPLVEVNINNLD